jgi:Mg2+ and Co2+ transporter CorA
MNDELTLMSRKMNHFLKLLVHVIEDDSFSAGATVYLRDVFDNLEIYDEDVKILISLCESVDDDAEKFQARQMDTTLYYLTVISATFLPAQFLTGTL